LQTDPSDTDAEQLVMLLETGSVDISATRLDIQFEEWMSSTPFFLRGVHVQDGNVVVTNSEGKVFSVQPEQPFVLQEHPESVHIVTSDGTVWSVPVDQVRIQPES
jgi:hypothetical protein